MCVQLIIFLSSIGRGQFILHYCGIKDNTGQEQFKMNLFFPISSTWNMWAKQSSRLGCRIKSSSGPVVLQSVRQFIFVNIKHIRRALNPQFALQGYHCVECFKRI